MCTCYDIVCVYVYMYVHVCCVCRRHSKVYACQAYREDDELHELFEVDSACRQGHAAVPSAHVCP